MGKRKRRSWGGGGRTLASPIWVKSDFKLLITTETWNFMISPLFMSFVPFFLGLGRRSKSPRTKTRTNFVQWSAAVILKRNKKWIWFIPGDSFARSHYCMISGWGVTPLDMKKGGGVTPHSEIIVGKLNHWSRSVFPTLISFWGVTPFHYKRRRGSLFNLKS